MKIAIDARFVGNGSGLGRYTYKLLEYILKLDQENKYCVIVYNQDKELIKFPYGNYEVLGVDYVHYTIGEQTGFWWWLNSLKCDLVHFTNFNHPILYRGKFVVTIHDLTLLFYPGRVRRKWVSEWGYMMTMKNAVKQARKVIAISEFTKRDVVKYLNAPEHKVSVVYEAPDERIKKVDDVKEIDRIKKKYKITKPYYLYVGQWRVHKNLVKLIEAFNIIRDKGLDTQLLLVGKEDPRYPEVRETINKSKYRHDIIITGFVPDEDFNAIYSGALVFVFPSLYEGIGLPPLEAMNCGIPVISSEASCMPEILQQAVLYFNPYDVKEIAFAMEKIYQDGLLRKELVFKGYELIKNYSWEKMARETWEIYGQVLKNR